MRHFLTSVTLFKLAVSSVPGRFVGSRLMISTAFAAILALICTSPLKAAIIDSIVKAPIVPDGDVAGAATDLVINLDTSLDPAVTGRTLLAGKTIKVVLPDAFVNNGAFPIQDFFTCPDFSQCNTAILLQGWPQYPILPSVPPGTGPAQYSLSFEGTNTIVITAEADITPGVALAGPGIKQIHIILQGFANPAAGSYSVEVIAETGPGGRWRWALPRSRSTRRPVRAST